MQSGDHRTLKDMIRLYGAGEVINATLVAAKEIEAEPEPEPEPATTRNPLMTARLYGMPRYLTALTTPTHPAFTYTLVPGFSGKEYLQVSDDTLTVIATYSRSDPGEEWEIESHAASVLVAERLGTPS